ncbi:hypothetical protein ABPG74_019472 [Tetrahymena malaccensis]
MHNNQIQTQNIAQIGGEYSAPTKIECIIQNVKQQLKNNQLVDSQQKQEYQKQFKTHPIPGVFERLSQDMVKKNQQTEPSLLSQIQKYYSEEIKEFSLLSPNFMAKKKIQEMIEEGTLNEYFFEHKANPEEGDANFDKK